MALETAFFSGMATACGLIVAIGAQNAFVLRQSVLGAHVTPVVLVSIVGDVVLIAIGALGIGSILAQSAILLQVVKLFGAAFVGWVGIKYVFAAVQGISGLEAGAGRARSKREAVLTAFAFSFLNPHAILDTVVLLGSVSAAFAGTSRVAFASGAMLVSCLWFILLGFGGRLLAPVLSSETVWRYLNGAFGCLMFGIVYQLLKM